jgi:hypothetical protein
MLTSRQGDTMHGTTRFQRSSIFEPSNRLCLAHAGPNGAL